MRIRIVDAFSTGPFTGNPAGVVLLDADDFPSCHWMQNVAREANQSETAFAHPLPPGGEADWALRWFTPATEVTMCGHATLATAHVLHTTGKATGTVRFATRSGILTTTANDDATFTMDFPTAPLTPVQAPPAITHGLGGIPILGAYATGPQVGDLLVELADEEAVDSLSPNFATLAGQDGRGVIATARADTPDSLYDVRTRCFFPNVGINEDPVTGSAHTALAPFWAERLGHPTLASLQGGARTGLVRTQLRGDRTLLTGSAVTVIDGELLATP
ncbi:PhzF family phenazine biosynthesis protein [Streptomyces catenulae]|uniref:PhzF family phenazine biosynthesis protein n=1 Tax=Streptomyces catenulae TaxID=66875 RepID=A0ABV2Z4D0_9ACTN|nr:PhzF family phenazine biosynthesis protein [Streptomyces catenulae]